MKQKKFKPSNNYRRDFGSKRGRGGSSKRPLIIGIAIGGAVLLIAAVIVGVLLFNKGGNGSSNIIGSNSSQGGTNQGGTNQGGVTVDNTPSAPEKDVLVNIQITHLPDKTSYYCGESFESAGLSVYGLTKEDHFVKLDLFECEITGFDSSVAVTKQTITVTYKGFTDTFTINIKEAPKPVTNAVVSVVVETLPKTEYKLNEFLETTGGVLLCTYADGTTKRVDLDPEYVTGFRYAMKVGAGEHELTVTYTEKNVSVETTYKITITQ